MCPATCQSTSLPVFYILGAQSVQCSWLAHTLEAESVRCFIADVLEACLVMRGCGQATEEQASCAECGI